MLRAIVTTLDKRSAVAEMGDRGHNIQGRGLGPHLTKSPGLRPTSMPSMLCSLPRSCLVLPLDRFDSEGCFSSDQVIFLTVFRVFW